ncbi:Fc.00g112850.m01.CDS01 [Cosmosporella sp. VM-42]
MSYKVCGKEVGPIGYGLMGLTGRAVRLSDDEAFAAMKAALDLGCNYWNGGEFYARPESPDHNTPNLLRRYFEKYPEDSSKVVINIKGGLVKYVPDGSKEGISSSIDNVLNMLGPKVKLDQFEAARKDPNTDYEKQTLAAIEEYVKAGKVGGISCSEVSATTLRSAAKAGFKITALETELSLFCTEPLENGLLEACAELDIPVLAYSPLGRGFLTGQLKSIDDLDEKDYRRFTPRYQGENFTKNLELVKDLEKLAAKKGCTPGQIAINWILALSKRPGMPKIIPIPGASSAERVKENSTIIDLTEDDLKGVEDLLASFTVSGDRYPAAHMAYLNA